MVKSQGLALACAAVLAASVAHASPQSSAGAASQTAAMALEEIVVTAQRREERFQDVPVSITVVDQGQLLDRNITEVSQLALAAPSFTSHPGNGGSLAIRGVGTASFSRSAEGDVALIVDGVPLPGGANPQDPSALFDVKQVEVLSGPQGTLFGKNAAAGAINIVTNAPDPTAVGARAHVDYDDRNAARVQAVINLPVTESSALRFSGNYDDPGDIYYDRFRREWNDQHSAGGRVRYLYSASDRLQINVIADYNRLDATGINWSIVDAPPASFLTAALAASCGIRPGRENSDTCLEAESILDFENYGGSAQIEYQLAGGLTLTSISAGRKTSFENNFDSDSVPVNNIFNRNGALTTLETFTQEFRLTSQSGGPLEYVAGLYFYDSSQTASGYQVGTFNNPTLVAMGATFGNSFAMSGDSRSVAAFGQAKLRLSDRWSLLGGVRFTSDEVSARVTKFVTPGSVGPFRSIAPIAAETDQEDVSGKLGVQLDLTPQAMLYATATKGYKGPAINDQASDPSLPLVVKAEVPWNYELGTKLTVLDGRLLLAATAYYMEIDDYQVQILDTSTARSYFGNIEMLEVQGVELSAFGAPASMLSIALGLSYNDGKYGDGTSFGCAATQTAAQGCQTIVRGGSTARVADASGNKVVGTPQWKATSFAELHVPVGGVELFVQADAVYSDRVTYSAVYDPANSFDSYWLLGARVGIRGAGDRWSVAIFGRNLTDERVPAAVFETPIAASLLASGSHAQYLTKDSFRRIGASLDFRF